MKYHEMTKNYIFREFECGLTKEQTSELCFKSVRTVTEWDKGKQIPPECKRLMRIVSSRNQRWLGIVSDAQQQTVAANREASISSRIINWGCFT